jgi:hypothetical protein
LTEFQGQDERRWPVRPDLEVDLDGPEIIFSDGTAAGVDSDYDAAQSHAMARGSQSPNPP